VCTLTQTLPVCQVRIVSRMIAKPRPINVSGVHLVSLKNWLLVNPVSCLSLVGKVSPVSLVIPVSFESPVSLVSPVSLMILRRLAAVHWDYHLITPPKQQHPFQSSKKLKGCSKKLDRKAYCSIQRLFVQLVSK